MSEAWKEWERDIAREARKYGLPWERRLRGGDPDDMLDIDGPLPDGWLIGGKHLTRTGNLSDRMSAAMLQCDRAMVNLAKRYPGHHSGVVPVQIIKRQGYTVDKAYAVMQYDRFLGLVLARREWNATLSEATG